MKLPNVGDRVTIGDNAELFIVVAIDAETQSASLIPASEVESVGLELVKPIPPPLPAPTPPPPPTPISSRRKARL